MARTMGIDSLEQKIEKAHEKVVKTKASYDSAIKELQKLLDKRTAIRNDEIIKAVASSERSYEEIIRFITG